MLRTLALVGFHIHALLGSLSLTFVDARGGGTLLHGVENSWKGTARREYRERPHFELSRRRLLADVGGEEGSDSSSFDSDSDSESEGSTQAPPPSIPQIIIVGTMPRFGQVLYPPAPPLHLPPRTPARPVSFLINMGPPFDDQGGAGGGDARNNDGTDTYDLGGGDKSNPTPEDADSYTFKGGGQSYTVGASGSASPKDRNMAAGFPTLILIVTIAAVWSVFMYAGVKITQTWKVWRETAGYSEVHDLGEVERILPEEAPNTYGTSKVLEPPDLLLEHI